MKNFVEKKKSTEALFDVINILILKQMRGSEYNILMVVKLREIATKLVK